MKKTINAALLMLMVVSLFIGCTKNTINPESHVIDPGIKSSSQVSFTPPKGLSQPDQWQSTSGKFILNSGIAMYQTPSKTDPEKFLVEYRLADKQAIRMVTFKRISSNMRQFKMSDLDGNVFFEMSLREDNRVGNFKFPNVNNQRTAFGDCMQGEIDKCMDSWGCSLFMLIEPVVYGGALIAYCALKVGSTYHLN